MENGGFSHECIARTHHHRPRSLRRQTLLSGTRIWVSLVLNFLADGMTEAELLAEYPQLVREDVLAAIAYGAEVAREH
jgi:uncharacterized protein (DUF433 family)